MGSTPQPLRIAVIGAGSAGLTMAKQIVDATRRGYKRVEFVVFERRSNVGGIWQYDESVKPGYLAWEASNASLTPTKFSSNGQSSLDKNRRLRFAWREQRPPGPMFDGLRTNIPCDLMSYRDSPFAADTHIFPDRQTVQSYLEAYARSHQLTQHIRFSTVVTNLTKVGHKWELKSRKTSHETTTTQEQTEYFSHVVVCHGRCNTPNIPNLPGLEGFTGKVTHSAWYRDPSTIKERKVLIVGNASSGMDLARELVGYLARSLPSGLTPDQWKRKCEEDTFTVYSSWHSVDKPPTMDFNPLDPASPDWCRHIHVVAQIDHVDGPTIHLEDGTILQDIELVIFATGFLFDNEYIDQSSEPLLSRPLLPPSNSDRRTGFPSSSMYNMDDWLLFHCKDESIAFLGLPITVVPFPFTEAQATYVIHRWLDMADRLPKLDIELPPSEADRWTSRRPPLRSQHNDNKVATQSVPTPDKPVLETTSHTFGHPSDVAYVDSLLSMLQMEYPAAGKPPPWQKSYVSDGQGNGSPKGEEAKYATTQWRNERRANGKALRRQALGIDPSKH